jgi:hypothetical protein
MNAVLVTVLIIVVSFLGIRSIEELWPWIGSCFGVSSARTIKTDPARRSGLVSHQNVIGLPATYFSDEELRGSRVRLLSDQELGSGYSLMRGERFVVAGIAIKTESYGKIICHERHLQLTNHRAKMVPIPDVDCELLFDWPVKVEGNKPDGR